MLILKKACITLPQNVMLNFKKDYIENVIRKKEARNLLNEALKSIAAWRRDHRIPIRMMLVKGAALNLLIYSEPWYTRSADIDLLFDLPAASLPEEARSTLIDRLESLNVNISRFHTHLEYDFNIHHDLTINGILPINVDRIWREARSSHLDGHDLWVMSPEDNLIACAIACCRRRYFYLKPLLDLSECIRHFESHDWKKVIENAHSDRVAGILYAGLWLAKVCLDAPTPDWVLQELRVPGLQKELIKGMSLFLLAHFSLAHLTQVWDESAHHLTAALGFTFITYKPSQFVRRFHRSVDSALHG